MFPLNAWYVACSSDEIQDRPLGRMICNLAMVVYRGSGGKVAILEDFCPHRGAPLSLGKVVEGELVCGYHGLVMGCDGATRSMPGQRVRGFPTVRRFPAVERYGFVWVWPGEAGAARDENIPVLPWHDKADWAFGGGVMHVKCDYRLMIDNLMDLTHETYVHATSIGQKEIDETPCVTRIEDGIVTTSRHMSGIQAPPFWQMGLKGNGLPVDQSVDRWQVCRYVPPSNVLIDVGVALAGQGGIAAPAAVKAAGIVVDLLTPETDDTMWYYWGLARNFRADDAALTDTIRTAQQSVFLEDVAMLEGQQRNLARQRERKLLMLNIDSGGVQARRLLDGLIAQERSDRGSAV